MIRFCSTALHSEVTIGAWPTTYEHCWGGGRWVERFFEAIGDLLVTGPTLTNVNDFRAVLIERAEAKS